MKAQAPSYDHRVRAGNQGDVVKHVALVAALETVADDWSEETFRYADIFAGHARYELGADTRERWRAGIGLFRGCRRRLQTNRHVAYWVERYLSGDIPPRTYPGSSVIARDVLIAHKTAIHLSLWDISPPAIADLRREFDPKSCDVFPSNAKWTDAAVRRANFLFIDPPGLSSRNRKRYPKLDDLAKFLSNRPAHQSLLVWLPVNADTTSSPPGEDSASWEAQEASHRFGCDGIRVRWAKGGKTIGCQLIWKLPDAAASALIAAVKWIVKVTGWQSKLPPGINAVSETRPTRRKKSRARPDTALKER